MNISADNMLMGVILRLMENGNMHYFVCQVCRYSHAFNFFLGVVLGFATVLPATPGPFASVLFARPTPVGSVGLAWDQNPDPDSSAYVR